ncbi:MAG: tetratricopeptide repeat protein [Rhodospirillaceae bacterium]|nr:tetratricopeptide repeat protein [Rhodospirillaceae bacterium]
MARRIWLAAGLAAALALSGPALAAGLEELAGDGEGGAWSGDFPPLRSDNDLETAADMIVDGDLEGSVPVLEGVLGRNPGNADALNLLGYVHRRLGDFEGALVYYNQALDAEPLHLGALNYLGYAYLGLDDPDAATEVLGRLQAICTQGCAEADDLAAAIEAYAAGFPIQ